jgi:CheY-like chemotaxis protein
LSCVTAADGADYADSSHADSNHDGAHQQDGHARDFAELRVRDNGVGMEATLLPHVFDMFTQAERTLERSGGGMGVGLTLVRKLVELHGGAITAHSDGPGHGSEFVVRLPMTGQRPAAPVDSKEPRPNGRRKILLVEDNDDARHTLAILLRMEGHDVHQAADGEAGLAAVIESPPDVALVDIGLPRLDGYEVARRIRARPELADVLLIAVTGYGQDSDRQAILQAGFDEHLVKPVDVRALSRAIGAFSVAP